MSIESVLVWQVIAGIVSIGLSVGGVLYVQHRADLRQLRRWARQDGVPLTRWRDLRAHYAEILDRAEARP